MRPKLDYSSSISNPQQQIQIKHTEQVQRNAARFVAGRPFNPYQPDSVSSIISSLQWPSLQSRQQRADIILLYRVVHSLIAVPISHLPSPALIRSTRQSERLPTLFLSKNYPSVECAADKCCDCPEPGRIQDGSPVSICLPGLNFRLCTAQCINMFGVMPFFQPCLFHYTLYDGGTVFILIRKCLPLGVEE